MNSSTFALPSAKRQLRRRRTFGRCLPTKRLRGGANAEQNEQRGKEAGELDSRTSEPVRPVSAGLQRHREGPCVVDSNRRGHGEDGGTGEAQVEKPTRQVLQSEEANGEETLPSADRRQQRGGEARPGAVRPAGLAQRLRQVQGGDRRGARPRLRHTLLYVHPLSFKTSLETFSVCAVLIRPLEF